MGVHLICSLPLNISDDPSRCHKRHECIQICVFIYIDTCICVYKVKNTKYTRRMHIKYAKYAYIYIYKHTHVYYTYKYTREHEYTKSTESLQKHTFQLKCCFFPLSKELPPKLFLIFQRLAASLCCIFTCSQCFWILSSLMKAWISSGRRGQWLVGA